MRHWRWWRRRTRGGDGGGSFATVLPPLRGEIGLLRDEWYHADYHFTDSQGIWEGVPRS